MTAIIRDNALNPEMTVVALSGRLDMEMVNTDAPRLLEAIAQNARGVVIDLSGVEFLSSSGLRMLLSANQKAQEGGKKLALAGVRPAVYKIFKVSALDGMFRFFETEAEAVGAAG